MFYLLETVFYYCVSKRCQINGKFLIFKNDISKWARHMRIIHSAKFSENKNDIAYNKYYIQKPYVQKQLENILNEEDDDIEEEEDDNEEEF